ncbi:unnamed protein product [Schistocephalus solidus]|uniref:Reverse transcriptase domain-containing protein n=1 Tax=Schistocephalus solidus TaxID=70667 RepID=A0A183T0B6_SCHSO|nr:unnamed protein product [Schistocephalus solidus]
MRTQLSTAIVDLTKAFDTVNSDRLWKVMQKFGCPERFTHMVRQLHDGMTVRVTDNGTVSEAFAVTNGVKQGCVLALTLFSLMFSAMLMDAYHDEQPGIRIAYRTDGHLLNSRRMQATTTAKMVVLHEPPPSAEYNAPQIHGAQVKNVEPSLIYEARCHATQNRRRGCSMDLQSQSSLRPFTLNKITRKSLYLHHPAVERMVDLVAIDGRTIVCACLSPCPALQHGG